MKSTFLIIATVLALSESSFAMEREYPEYSVDPITAIAAVAAATVSTIYIQTQTGVPSSNEILLSVDDEQLAALQETVVIADDRYAHNRILLKTLFRRLARYYYDSGSSTPTRDLAWLLKMREVVCLTLIAAETAAKDALRYFAKDEVKAAANASPLSSAVNAIMGVKSWQHFCTDATCTATDCFFQTATYVQNMARYTVKPGATKQEIAQAAYDADEKVALTWLLGNIEIVTTQVLPWFFKDLSGSSIPVSNPFQSIGALVPFVNEHFGGLKEEEMIFLAPWLVLILPLNAVPEIHRPLFIHLRAMLIWPQVAPLMVPQEDIGNLAELPPELVEMFLVTFFELMGPQPR